MNLRRPYMRVAAAALSLVMLSGCQWDLLGSHAAAKTESIVPSDVRSLIRPSDGRKYLGVAVNGAPRSTAPLDKFAKSVRKRPTIVEYYTAWGDQFEGGLAKRVWDGGALPLIAWEPFKPSLREIARGRNDAYIRRYAEQVRRQKVPVAISFGHEMNSWWYPWGTRNAKPADYVGAYRRIHNIFRQAGATSVIWLWSPNVINSLRKVKLKPYYPGDAYVDWIGLIGYYEMPKATFNSIFAPTIQEIGKFTRRPYLIQETGSAQQRDKAHDVAELFSKVASHRSFVGLVWFNYNKRADWRIESDPKALAQFRRSAAHAKYRLDVKRP